MKLKKILTQAPSPEIAQYYTQQGNQWVLDLEGDDQESPKVAEFRQKNIELMKELEAQKANNGKLTDLEKKLETLVGGNNAPKNDKQASSVEDKIAHLTKLIEEERAKSAKAESTARLASFESNISTLAQKAGVRSDASGALLRAARETFKEQEGKIVPLGSDGKVRYSPKTGTDPLSVEEWLEDLKTSEPFYFATPKGGTATGQGAIIATGAKIIDREMAGNHIDDLANGKAVLAPKV